MRALSLRVAAIWALTLISCALIRIHIRVVTTNVAYHLGHLKGRESGLLEQRSKLQATLAKLTSKKELQDLSGESRPIARTDLPRPRAIH